jgi:hypothetical protein
LGIGNLLLARVNSRLWNDWATVCRQWLRGCRSLGLLALRRLFWRLRNERQLDGWRFGWRTNRGSTAKNATQRCANSGSTANTFHCWAIRLVASNVTGNKIASNLLKGFLRSFTDSAFGSCSGNSCHHRVSRCPPAKRTWRHASLTRPIGDCQESTRNA